MKVLLIGSGGREHALAWKMAQSPKLDKLYIAPGNGGTGTLGENIGLNPGDHPALKAFLTDKNIDMVVVGPEAPLVNGITDFIEGDKALNHITVIGPGKKGAQLEGSKEFAKSFMQRHNIPTASYKAFGVGQYGEACSFLDSLKPPYVLKADGLAAGKGVLILGELEEAKQELRKMFDGKFGLAGKRIVIEEFLDGIELSVFVLTDGKSYKLLPEAKDYKRIGEGGTGLNTGGMGAVSPVPFAGDGFMKKVEERIVKPTIDGLHEDKLPYKGFVFFGLMSVNGAPFVIEYNARMGDPECEVVLPRINHDLLDLFEHVGTGTLSQVANIAFDERVAMSIMLVSGGYPGKYEKGKTITGLNAPANGIFFQAGTKIDREKTVTSGGRVVACTHYGHTIGEAKKNAIQMAEQIQFNGKYYRKDIGDDLI